MARPAVAGCDALISLPAATGRSRIAAPGPVEQTAAGGAALFSTSPKPGGRPATGPAPPPAPASGGGGGGGAVVAAAAAADPGDATGSALGEILAVGGDEVGDVMLDPVTLEVRHAPVRRRWQQQQRRPESGAATARAAPTPAWEPRRMPLTSRERLSPCFKFRLEARARVRRAVAARQDLASRARSRHAVQRAFARMIFFGGAR